MNSSKRAMRSAGCKKTRSGQKARANGRGWRGEKVVPRRTTLGRMQTKAGAFCSNETGKARTQGLTHLMQRRKSKAYIKVGWGGMIRTSARRDQNPLAGTATEIGARRLPLDRTSSLRAYLVTRG